jgi:hypothetical protein
VWVVVEKKGASISDHSLFFTIHLLTSAAAVMLHPCALCFLHLSLSTTL